VDFASPLKEGVLRGITKAFHYPTFFPPPFTIHIFTRSFFTYQTFKRYDVVRSKRFLDSAICRLEEEQNAYI
jgi:hypothetical protein